MDSFTAIDFETGNPQRVSACALGFAVVERGEIIQTGMHLIKPIGGHATFQTRIHGITEDQTSDKPTFDHIYNGIKNIFSKPVVGHSQFDKQVLNALCDHFGLGFCFDYFDSSYMAKTALPNLKNHKLQTVAKYFGLPDFHHHDALEDAITCARIVLALDSKNDVHTLKPENAETEYRGLLLGIIADDRINYKEAYSLLYWLEDHHEVSRNHLELYQIVKEFCRDKEISNFEEAILIEMINDEINSN